MSRSWCVSIPLPPPYALVIDLAGKQRKLHNNHGLLLKWQAVPKCLYIMNYTWRKLPGEHACRHNGGALRPEERLPRWLLQPPGETSCTRGRLWENFAAANSIFKDVFLLLKSCRFGRKFPSSLNLRISSQLLNPSKFVFYIFQFP